MAAENKFDDDRYWSDETCLLKEIPERKLPVLVKVNEGIYSEDDCSTFSRGDIIKIDSCQHIERAEGFFAKWEANRYNKTTTEVAIPLHYKGLVNVLPMKGVAFEYTSVNQLMQYFPKKVRTGFGMTFQDLLGKNCTLLDNEVLEILKIHNHKEHGAGLLVRTRTSDIILPRNLKGSFIIVSHDRKYTIKDVMTFQMPLCIRFVDQGFDTTVSKSFQEAAANVKIFQREVILTGKIKKTTVLCGHYKALDPDPSSTVCRRSAIILSLDNEDIANIEVQFPIDMDEHDYEDFVLHHFKKKNTKQSVEGLLYLEFSKVPGVRFIPEPDIPPSPPPSPPSPSLSLPPPPRPPRLFHSLSTPKEETETKLLRHSEAKSATFPAPVPEKKTQLTRSKSSSAKLRFSGPLQLMTKYMNKEYKDTTPDSSIETQPAINLIGDSFTTRTTEKDNVEYTNPLNKLKKERKFAILGRRFMEQTRFLTQEACKRMSVQFVSSSDVNNKTPPVGNDGNVYDCIDQDSHLQDTDAFEELQETCTENHGNEKLSARVTSQSDRTQPKMTEQEEKAKKDFAKMSIHELSVCFLQCGMPKLEAICRRHNIDGETFASFSRDQLKRKPFSLTDFQITKVEKILRGWRPKE